MGSFCFHSVLPFIWGLVSFQDVSSVRAKADLFLHPLSVAVVIAFHLVPALSRVARGYGLRWEQSVWAGHLPFLPYLLMPAYFCLRAGVCVCAHVNRAQTLTPCDSHRLTFLESNCEERCYLPKCWCLGLRRTELGLPSVTKMVACMKSWLQFLCIWLFASIFQMWSPPQWPYLQRWEILMGRPRSAWPVEETRPLPQVIYVYVGIGWLLGWMLAVVYLFFNILVCTHVCMCE